MKMGITAITLAAVGTGVIMMTMMLFGWIDSIDPSELSKISWFTMLTNLPFGLALFLFGMGVMEDALRAIAGSRMKMWLKRFTYKPILGVATGAVVTAIIQSSSVTTVMLVSFVSAELMAFSRAIPVLFGANIGTTITAQLLAFKITHFAPLIGFVGFAMTFSKDDKVQGIGKLFFGLALIFFGMGFMSDAMKPLRDFQPFMDLMVTMNNPWAGLLVATIFTALVQSSSATMGLIVVMAIQGLITIEAGIALALGANVGTCVTAAFAAIGKSRPAIRVAMAHIVFNLFGSFFFIWLIPYLSWFVSSISEDVPRQVANAHTTFNIVVAFIFLPLTKHLANLTVRLLPDLPVEEDEVIQPKYLLSEKDMAQPMGSIIAIDGVRKEIYRMGKKVREMYKLILPAMTEGTRDDLRRIVDMDADVNILHKAILHNIHAMRHSLNLSTEEQMEAFRRLWMYPDMFESIADVISHEMIKDGFDRIDDDIVMSDETKTAIREFHAAIQEQLTAMLLVIKASDPDLTPKQEKKIDRQRVAIVDSRSGINKMQETLKAKLQLARLESGAASRMTAYIVEDDIVTHLRYFYNGIRKIAKVKRPLFNIEREKEVEDVAEADAIEAKTLDQYRRKSKRKKKK
jgi:phosphate:Na+ symporter